jgi:hypothetical protein
MTKKMLFHRAGYWWAVALLWEPRDLWVGVYWNTWWECGEQWVDLYVCPVPLLPIRISFITGAKP